MTDLARQQTIRLSNTLLAAAGGVVLSAALIFGHVNGYLLISAIWLATALALFWAVNIAFILAIKSGYNLRFGDPALSVPQMYWATSCAMAAIAISTRLDLVLYLMTLITVVFGIFRATERQFNVLCAYVIAVMLLMHCLRGLLVPHAVTWDVLMQWLVFSFCAVTLTRLCQAIVKLRNRLREQNQELKEALQAKNYFLANMSHEIRTPMNGVLGMLDIALNTDLADETRRYLGIAQSSANALLTIINDILDFSKIEAGKLRIEPVAFDLEQLINEVVAAFGAKAEAKRLELILDIAPDTPLYIKADPVRLRQILNNLVANALKFTERGEIVVAVEPREVDGRLELLWSVKDSGIGIAMEKQLELFASFTQADASTTRLYGGTGLGLAICKQLCQLMGGSIGVESEPGRGSCFFFTLPVAKAEAELAATPDPYDPNLLSGKRILVVDDNATNRLVLRKQLEHQGAWVIEAEDAKQALIRLAQDAAIDIALLDMQMPAVDGVMLARLIRTQMPDREMILVLLSSGMQELESGLLRSLGISASLYKPVPPQRLLRALVLALGNRGKLVQAGLLDVVSGRAPTESPAMSPAALSAQKVNQEARLLLVEDNDTNRDVAEVALETLGYAATMVYDGREAVAEVKRAQDAGWPYKLVLMDCQMPQMDGYEATRQIRQWEARSSVSPLIIIAMTANAMAGDREKCLAAGMNDYLSKPVQLEVLQSKLNQWLRPAGEVEDAPAAIPNVLAPEALVWDVAALLKLVRQKEERMVKLIQSFLAGLDAVEREIVQALHRGDRTFAARQIHGLKGSSANLGARALPVFLANLEARLGQDEQLNVESEVQALQSHVIRLRGAMQSYLDVSYRPSA
ncbi:MAG: response regulator [Cellvibrionaceae bacterium]|nr:response regulator [Cellvibrionaceae bacterium]